MTRIAELQDRLRRLAKRREGEGIYTDAAICEEAAESLSRTGAVKVPAEASKEMIEDGVLAYNLTGIAGGVINTAEDHVTFIWNAMAAHLSALEPAAPEGQQPVAWQHIPNCGVDRESKMVHVTGKVFCDPCIAPLVAALNAASIETVASCCGHGHRPGVIVLRDGRELFIAKDFEEARKVDAAFPTDINGDARPSEQAVTEAMIMVASDQISEGLGAYLRKFADSDAAKQARYWLHKMPDTEWNGMARLLAEEALGAALKAAMEAGR